MIEGVLFYGPSNGLEPRVEMTTEQIKRCVSDKLGRRNAVFISPYVIRKLKVNKDLVMNCLDDEELAGTLNYRGGAIITNYSVVGTLIWQKDCWPGTIYAGRGRVKVELASFDGIDKMLPHYLEPIGFQRVKDN